MKKITLLFALCFLFLPSFVHASIFSNFIEWFVPADLKPEIIEVTQRGVGGVLITASPALLSGDTDRTYLLPSLGGRSFALENQGAVDLYLNKFSTLRYSASPSDASGDIPTALALNVGSARIVIINNPSTTTSYYLSKTDLSIVASGTTTQPYVFLKDIKAKANIVDGTKDVASLASFSFSFSLNNTTNKDVYVSRVINSRSFLVLTPVPQAATNIKFVEASPASIVGDNPQVFVIPAGTDRRFEVTGIVDNTQGIPGPKNISVDSISYSNSASLSSLQSLTTATQLRGLSVVITLGSGKLPEKFVTPANSSVPENSLVPETSTRVIPVIPKAPQQSVSPAPSPKVSLTPTATPTVPSLWVPRPTPTKMLEATLTPSPTATPKITTTPTPVYSPTPSPTPVYSSTPTVVVTPAASPTPTPSPSPTPSPTPVTTSSAVVTPTATAASSRGATSTPVSPSTGSVTSGNISQQGMVATVLYSLGEFLDLLFER